MMEKPGERALEAMKKMNNAVVEFKMPKVPKKIGQMKILTEEQYIEVKTVHFHCESITDCVSYCFFFFLKQELGKLIQKDFFPDLEKLKAQNEYLDAMEKNDVIKLREIYAKYSGRRPNEPVGCKSFSRICSFLSFEIAIYC